MHGNRLFTNPVTNVIHLINEIPFSLQLMTKYTRINAEKSFIVYLSTLLIFEYLCDQANIQMN